MIVNEKVIVTHKLAQPLVSLADRLVTYAKIGDQHHRRLAAAVVRQFVVDEKNQVLALDKLLDVIGPRFAERKGGYARKLKMTPRLGDNAPRFLITFSE